MHSRSLAGWKGLRQATAVAGFALLSLSWTSTEAAAPESTSGGAAGLERAAQPDSEFRRPLLFPRTNYVWPYASGPVYDTVDAVRWKESGVLHTRVGSFDLKRGGPAIPEELRATVKAGLPQYFIMQVDPASFADGRFDHVRALIEDQGGALLEGMSVGGYITRLTPAVQGVLKSQPGVVAVEPYHPAFKLAPTIGRVPLPDPARAVSEVYALEALLHPGENAEVVARALADMGANVTKVDPDVVYFEVHRSKLGQVAGLEPVKAVFESLPNLAFGEETTVAMQTGRYGGGATPYHDAGVRGDGGGIAGTSAQILMVLDTGVQLDAADLSNTRTNAGTAGAGHRKVRLYTTAIGGSGDALGCDAGPQGGFTHGQTVSATALGNATDVPPLTYGAGWRVEDTRGNLWKVDGVAPRALLLAYDAHVTPSTLSCGDPTISGLAVGTIYTDNTPGSGSLGDGYVRGARVFNFSWGSTNNNTYATNATRTDAFLFDHLDAMVFVAAGNDGTDVAQNLEPDPLSISDPATCKSCIVVGASGNVDDPDDGGNEQDRAAFSSVGPTAVTGRINPVLMAPGTDFGTPGNNMGVDSEYSCRTNDNDQANPVECDLVDSIVGTSFSAPAAAGSALLVRDWFAQGFYPDGTSTNPANAGDQVANISGALLKAVLVTSADWMEGGEAVGGNTFQAFRFNREQGYGRITLSNALPLSTYNDSPTGIIISDGGLLAGGRVDISGIPGSSPAAGTTQTGTIRINSNQKELRCALAWVEDAGDAISHDLDLEMVAPSGKVYFGNFFTEDVDRDGILDAGENCLDRGPVPNTLDEDIWNIETNACGGIAGSRRDTANPVEGIFLSPDYLDNGLEDDPVTVGINEGIDNQIEPGDWTLRVIYRTGAGSQRYAVSCSGPVATGSSVRLDQGEYACSDAATVTVNESTDATDATPTAAEVGARTTVQVIDVGVNGVYENGGGDDIVRDTETGAAVLAFTATGQRYESAELTLTDGTAYDPGNGALDVRNGNRIKVIYADKSNGSPDANKLRFNSSAVNCQTRISIGGVEWATFGKDAATLVNGGCERDARNLFTFGFPDKYMDAGELINYRIDFQSLETTEDLIDAVVTLRCVKADADSPATCLPSGGGASTCADPNRTNNPACTEMTVLDSPIIVSRIPAGEDVSANFNISMTGAITGTPKVDMLLGVTAKKAGKSVESLVVSRHVLDVDEASIFYSTDFPVGGNETRDYNENETVQVVTTNTGDFNRDYLFETRTYGDLTAGGTKNTGLQAPWNFDANNGAFRVGLNPGSTDLGAQVVANWGEDKNFNNLLDPGEDREPAPFGSGGTLDASWNTRGGCGWQTRGANPTGGIWHTGGIDLTSLACGAQCELVDTVVGTNGVLGQWEMLITPVVQKVNAGLDAEGDPTHQVQFTNWAWNMEMDLVKEWDLLLWELDTDTQSITRADLFNDQTILNFIGGNQGPVSGGNSPLTNGFQVFAPFSGTTSVNGTAGNNRVGKNACIFEIAGAAGRQADNTLGFAKPEDRSDGISDPQNPGQGDFDDDGDTLIDEFVTANGPIRNFDITQVNGPDLRFATLEDIYGDAGNSFQGSLGFWAQEGVVGNQPSAGYGVGVDDMVLEWREYSLAKDSTSCATGVCATLTVSVTNMFEGSGVVTVTVLDASPGAPGTQVNDCNFNGALDAGDDTDCDNNGTQDVVIRAFSDAEIAGELVFLNRVGASSQWRGELSFSSAINVAGVLYIVRSGVDAPAINVRYYDANDGTGAVCANDADVTRRGTIDTNTTVAVDAARIIVKGTRVSNEGAGVGGAGHGDLDGFADTNETVKMFLTLSNRSGAPRTGVVARLSSNDPKIECILDPVIVFGSLADKQTLEEASDFFLFKVKDSATVNRTDPNADLFAKFSVTVSGDDFDTVTRSQEIFLDLDLNVSGGLLPTSYTEGFEGAGFGSFTTMSLDAGKESLALSNGLRCQYNDPDFVNSNSYGNTFCFVGAFPANQNAFNWHVHGAASPDGGRAYLGANSLHWGIHPGAANADTTGMKQLDAIRTTNPVNLGWNNVVSDLSFKHQVGLSDCDYVNCDAGFTADRGVVQVQLANSAGTAIGTWRNITPYENLYDSQAVDIYTNCIFDPTDDGTTEDDYFDPDDPNRRLGPSSTCNPEFAFSRHGAIAFDAVFNVNALGHASDGPGLQGSDGPGTWIQTKFSLDRYRGRRIRLRFLATSIEVSNTITMQQALGWNPTEADDGWYIDDIQISNTLTSAATVTADTAANAGLPATCAGAACTAVTAALASDPGTTEAPGQLTSIDASGSSGGCRDGVLQYRFWTTNNNTTVGDAGDELLRTWTDNPQISDAPTADTRYGVQVRCSALVSCQNSATTMVNVTCPTTGNAVAPFAQSIGFSNKTTVAWTSSALVDVIRGNLITLRTNAGQFNGTVDACLGNNVTVSSVADATTPAVNGGNYYLVRAAGPSGFCNAGNSWKTGSAAEVNGVGGDRDADIVLDASSCP